MGKHTAPPPVHTDIPHKVAPVIKTKTHTFLVFCKHTLLELPAGLIAILIFEGNRGGWLHLIGSDHETTENALRVITVFTQ
jgi:hypothetical protein